MSEHKQAIALELTRIYYQTAVSKNITVDQMGRVQDVYLDILKSINNPASDQSSPIVTNTISDSTTQEVRVTPVTVTSVAANEVEAVPSANSPDLSMPTNA